MTKYTKLPGIRSLHDFVVVRRPTTGHAAVRVREFCYEGALGDAPIGVATGHDVSEDAFPKQYYSQSGKVRPLSSTKISQLKQMMESFVPKERQMNL